MKYLTLRDCYVGDQYRKKGEVYDLPDDMVKSEKNFKLVEGPAPAPGTSEAKTKPDVIPVGMYWCPHCESLHKDTDKPKSIGLKHQKYREVEPPPAPEPQEKPAEA